MTSFPLLHIVFVLSLSFCVIHEQFKNVHLINHHLALDNFQVVLLVVVDMLRNGDTAFLKKKN